MRKYQVHEVLVLIFYYLYRPSLIYGVQVFSLVYNSYLLHAVGNSTLDRYPSEFS